MKHEPGRTVPGGIGGQGVAAEAEVGDRAASGGAQEHEAGGTMRRRMMPCGWACSSALRRSRASVCTVGIGRGPRVHRLLQPLAVDPVADPVGELADDSDVVDVPDRGMIELAERLGLAQEPGAGGGRR